jgi:hypothetical protein
VQTPEIDQYIPFLLPTFIDILNQDSTQALPFDEVTGMREEKRRGEKRRERGEDR